jgi:hypothetical protein
MSDQMPIQQMLRTVKADGRRDEERNFGRDFERWWFAQDQVAWFARELRNDAAHRVYEKAAHGPLWRMEIAGYQNNALSNHARDVITIVSILSSLAVGIAAAFGLRRSV